MTQVALARAAGRTDRAPLRAVPRRPGCAEEVAAAVAAGHSIRLAGGDSRDRARVLHEVGSRLRAGSVAHTHCLTSPLTADIAGGSLAGVLPATLLDAEDTGTTAGWLRRAVTELCTTPVVLVDRAEWLDDLSAFLLAQGVVGGGLALAFSTGDAADPPGVLEGLDHAGHVAYAAVAVDDRPGALTAREREVAALARQGLSSATIARRLYLSVRTVDNHLTRAYAKLGISSRRQLAGRSL